MPPRPLALDVGDTEKLAFLWASSPPWLLGLLETLNSKPTGPAGADTNTAAAEPAATGTNATAADPVHTKKSNP